MLELLIAILIALGCNLESGTDIEVLKKHHYDEYVQAQNIMDSGRYKETDGGGVVIIDVGGD